MATTSITPNPPTIPGSPLALAGETGRGCAVCGRDLSTRYPNTAYCSKACKRRASYLRANSKTDSSVCKRCGASFTFTTTRWPSAIRIPSFCSAICRSRHRGELMSGVPVGDTLAEAKEFYRNEGVVPRLFYWSFSKKCQVPTEDPEHHLAVWIHNTRYRPTAVDHHELMVWLTEMKAVGAHGVKSTL